MSSHREAPEISKDPAADNTDVYAFVSPDKPDYVTLIANYNPFELPYGGPNFSEFADDVLYEIKVMNNAAGDGYPDVTYQFRFTTTVLSDATFLYNTGPISYNSAKNSYDNWNRPQTYSVTKVLRDGSSSVIATNLLVPPVNVGVRSTSNYTDLVAPAVKTVGTSTFFAGQRADAFHVDLGSIFDLAGIRPVNQAHLIPLKNMPGVNGLQGLNVHTIAIQVPKTDLLRAGEAGTDFMKQGSVIGVWATASRSRGRFFNATTGKFASYGDFQQISRLGIPLFNEVLTPMARKDYWNSQVPANDKQFDSYVNTPELAGLLPKLYPGVFPNLAKYTKPRADLNAIILTGIPAGVVVDKNKNTIFQNFTGTTEADMLRLNVAIPPTTKKPSVYGVVGGDLAGFPNGRRVFDDVTAIELKAIAGATIPLVDPSYTPDATAVSITDGTTLSNGATKNPSPTSTTANLLPTFPYLNTPLDGYQTAPPTPFGDKAQPAPAG